MWSAWILSAILLGSGTVDGAGHTRDDAISASTKATGQSDPAPVLLRQNRRSADGVGVMTTALYPMANTTAAGWYGSGTGRSPATSGLPISTTTTTTTTTAATVTRGGQATSQAPASMSSTLSSSTSPGVDALPSAQATHVVQVATHGQLHFDPGSLTAALGDVVVFEFSRSHQSVSESSLQHPCREEDGGFESGFRCFNASGRTADFVAFKVEDVAPHWFFGRQQGFRTYCGNDTVFAVNPGDKLGMFLDNARHAHNTSTPPISPPGACTSTARSNASTPATWSVVPSGGCVAGNCSVGTTVGTTSGVSNISWSWPSRTAPTFTVGPTVAGNVSVGSFTGGALRLVPLSLAVKHRVILISISFVFVLHDGCRHWM